MLKLRSAFRITGLLLASGLSVLTPNNPGWAAGPSQSELDQAAAATDTWLMTNKSYDGHRYVALDRITAANVATLKQVCQIDSGVAAPAQSSPVLYGGNIYLSAGQTTIAIDATSCREVWRHEWQLKGKALSNPNRGVAIKDGLVVRGTSDGYLIALNMTDGTLAWEHRLTGAGESHYLSMPAMIVGGKVIYGTAGADWGSRGWIGAFKLSDGSELWRFNAVPLPGEPGAETWGTPEALAHGGGSFWTPVSVDREANVVYVPVGNPAPDFFGDARKGSNLYTNSLVALDIETGKPKWAKQFVPHDVRDWDLSQTSPLLTATAGGKTRNLVAVSGKDGRLRLVDRDSHEVLRDIALSKQENTGAPLTQEGVHICPDCSAGRSGAARPTIRSSTSSLPPWWIGAGRRIAIRPPRCTRPASTTMAARSSRTRSGMRAVCSLLSTSRRGRCGGRPKCRRRCLRTSP